jgi:hypothetical protein
MIRLQNNWEVTGRGIVQQFAWNGWGQTWKLSPKQLVSYRADVWSKCVENTGDVSVTTALRVWLYTHTSWFNINNPIFCHKAYLCLQEQRVLSCAVWHMWHWPPRLNHTWYSLKWNPVINWGPQYRTPHITNLSDSLQMYSWHNCTFLTSIVLEKRNI